jgi:hypothetical protein
LVAALAVGIIAVAGVGAQEATPEPSEDAESETPRLDHYLEVLAGNLGVSVEELEAALTQTQIDLINEKVADGTLTQEEADEIIARIESGEGPYFPPFIGGHHGPLHRIVYNIVESAADVLGMDVEDLHAQLREGNSLADVAEAQGVDVEQFKTDLQAALQAKIDEAVANETITEEMGARLSEGLADAIGRIVEQVPGEGPFGGPFGGPGPFRGGPGFFEGPLEDTETGTDATSTTLFN